MQPVPSATYFTQLLSRQEISWEQQYSVTTKMWGNSKNRFRQGYITDYKWGNLIWIYFCVKLAAFFKTEVTNTL